MHLLSYNGRICGALLPNLLSSGEVTKYCLVFTINDVFLICNWFVEISDQLRGYSIFHVLCNFFLNTVYQRFDTVIFISSIFPYNFLGHKLYIFHFHWDVHFLVFSAFLTIVYNFWLNLLSKNPQKFTACC